MKIAMLGQKGIPAIYGGVERHVEDLSGELVKLGHEVLAYTRPWYTPYGAKNHDGVRVIHTPSIHTKHLDTLTHTFTATINAIRQKPDVIHYHGVGPSLLSWMPMIFSPKIKVVATFHCIDRYHQKWGWFARLMLKLGEWAACVFPHRTIAVSKTIQNYCLNEYHRQTDNIPNGVRLPSQPAGSNTLSQWNLESDKYLLMVSRLVRHKGAHHLIEAWRLARQQHPELLKNYKLAIVGDSAFTDKYVLWLKTLAGKNLDIVFTGWQKGKALEELYGNAALVIHPSENEGMSMAVLTAMAWSKAVLTADIPEQKELITDPRFYFTINNPMSLSEKIAELLKHPDWLAEAGERNRELVKNNFQWADIAKKTERLYQKNSAKNILRLKAREA